MLNGRETTAETRRRRKEDCQPKIRHWLQIFHNIQAKLKDIVKEKKSPTAGILYVEGGAAKSINGSISHELIMVLFFGGGGW